MRLVLYSSIQAKSEFVKQKKSCKNDFGAL
ncbi:hypothetical protein CLU83_0257 [Flavobacterium sp. 1]|nr:hypothetical protein CLU83_0257 [Flavobacterium sp. 1]